MRFYNVTAVDLLTNRRVYLYSVLASNKSEVERDAKELLKLGYKSPKIAVAKAESI